MHADGRGAPLRRRRAVRARARPPRRWATDERHLLWTLGKAIAMASVAREVTAYDEQSRQLQQRIDLAREIHEGVVQRLFGVSLALSREELLDAETQRRCALRCRAPSAICTRRLQRPLGHSSRPTAVTFEEELERVRGPYPDLEIVLREWRPGGGPRQSRGAGTVDPCRGGAQRAQARRCDPCRRIASYGGGTFVLEVRNDGAHLYSGGRGGSACAWRRSRRSSTAACSSTVSQSPGPGRCAWWCRPANEHIPADD